jgi:large subunit ribosomal protein L10
MKKQEKLALTQELAERAARSTMVLVSEYRGVSVGEANELRRRLRAANSELKVAKNTLIARAIAETDYAALREKLGGQVALIFCFDDPAVVAKVVTSFNELGERFRLRGGVIGGKPLDAQAVEEIANLPPKPVLMARLLGALLAPATHLVRVLNEPGSALARLIDAIGKKQAAGA